MIDTAIRRLCAAALALAATAPLPALAQSTGEAQRCIIEPHRTVKVGSQVQGILDEVKFDRGDIVKKGDVIGVLRSEVEKATVDLARAKAQNNAQIKAAQARVEFEKRRIERNQALYRKKVISVQDLDEMKTGLALRERELESAREDARISQFELKRAQAMLDIRTIHSPIGGVVTQRSLSPGEFILQDGNILTVAQIDPLNVEVFVPVSMLLDVAVGMSAKVMPEQPVGGVYDATVTIVDRVIDAASSTFGVRLELPNPDNELWAGLRCTVRFQKKK